MLVYLFRIFISIIPKYELRLRYHSLFLYFYIFKISQHCCWGRTWGNVECCWILQFFCSRNVQKLYSVLLHAKFVLQFWCNCVWCFVAIMFSLSSVVFQLLEFSGKKSRQFRFVLDSIKKMESVVVAQLPRCDNSVAETFNWIQENDLNNSTQHLIKTVFLCFFFWEHLVMNLSQFWTNFSSANSARNFGISKRGKCSILLI